MKYVEGALNAWRNKNFPYTDLIRKREHQLLGVVEEVGELSHAVLKRAQGIRGFENDSKYEQAATDAVGDILIYLQGFCQAHGWSMQEIYEATAHDVLQRDWQKDPHAGTAIKVLQDEDDYKEYVGREGLSE